MKKLIFGIVLITVTFLAYRTSVQGPVEVLVEPTPEVLAQNAEVNLTENITYHKDISKGLYIAKINLNTTKISLYEQPDPLFLKTMQDLIVSENKEVAINAGYFREDFEHAGLLVREGQIIYAPAFSDNQVTHIVNLENLLTFPNINEIDISSLNEAFQTGPLIIENSIVQEDLIKNSTNGNGNFRRSVLIVNRNNEAFFLSTTRAYSLMDLSNEILSNSFIGNHELNAINLDGGSSVAIFSTEKADFKIGEDKRLPFFLVAD